MYNNPHSHHAGGFMPASPIIPRGGEKRTTAETTTTPSRDAHFESQCLLPLTIKQIANAPIPRGDSNLRIDGVEVYHMTVMGWITRIDPQTTHTTFEVCDGTGRISVRLWNSDNDPVRAEKMKNLREQQWIRVIGRIQTLNNFRTITGFQVDPVEDFNSISLHLLEAIHTHLYNSQRIPPPSFDEFGDAEMAEIFTQDARDAFEDRGAEHSPDDDLSGKPIHKAIIEMLRDERYHVVNEGTHCDVIYETLKSRFSTDKIHESLQDLSNNGLIYATIDEAHFMLTTP